LAIDKPLSVSSVQNRSANELAIIGYEWLIVLAIIVVLFVWGPQKLPEFAKSIGLARKEIEKAYKEASSPSASPVETDPLIETAKKLGISTEGKTRSQISDEIVAKGKASEKPA
jgi:sec-independent protein translocase protein TatA